MEATKSISNMNVSQGTHNNIETEVRVCCYHLRLETVFDIYSVISMVEVEYLRKWAGRDECVISPVDRWRMCGWNQAGALRAPWLHTHWLGWSRWSQDFINSKQMERIYSQLAGSQHSFQEMGGKVYMMFLITRVFFYTLHIFDLCVDLVVIFCITKKHCFNLHMTSSLKMENRIE